MKFSLFKFYLKNKKIYQKFIEYRLLIEKNSSQRISQFFLLII